jgi:hypothetical protein
MSFQLPARSIGHAVALMQLCACCLKGYAGNEHDELYGLKYADLSRLLSQ